MEAEVTAFESSRCNEAYSKLPTFQQRLIGGIKKDLFICAGSVDGSTDSCTVCPRFSVKVRVNDRLTVIAD